MHRRPFHEEIAEVLRKEIRCKCSPGKKLAPEARLAKRFGVSIVTVREAMLLLVREGLVERRQGSGTYVLDAPLRRPAVALLMSESILQGRTSHFYRYLSILIPQLLEERGYATRTMLGRFNSTESLKSSTAEDLADGIESGEIVGVNTICSSPPPYWVEFLAACNVPLVGSEKGGLYTVNSDQYGLVKDATELLLANGRHRIAFLEWGPATRDEGSEDLFLDPFRKTLKEHAVPFRREWVFGNISPVQCGSEWERFRDLWKQSVEKPDGMIICDDCLYCEAAPAIISLNIQVPEELLVVSHANKDSPISYPFPTVRLECDPDEHARTRVEMLVSLIEGKNVKEPHVLLPHRWVGREILASLPTATSARAGSLGAADGTPDAP